jgi:hypothetical protein
LPRALDCRRAPAEIPIGGIFGSLCQLDDQMKLLKRMLLVVGVLVAVALVLGLIVYRMFRGTPDWYLPHALSAEQRAQHAGSAERKFAEVQNWVAERRARQARSGDGGPVASVTAALNHQGLDAGAFQVTADELNSFFDKWASFYHWDAVYAPYLKDPMVVLRDGRVIVAGTHEELGAVVSLHVALRLDDKRRLRTDLVDVLAGRLPVPGGVWEPKQRQIEHALSSRLPRWQHQATIDPNGAANDAAVYASLAKLVLHGLDRRPSAPFVFVPVIEAGDGGRTLNVPVKVTDVRVQEGQIHMSAEALTEQERVSFLAYLKQDEASASDVNAQPAGQ